jgi:hypothetical protein
MCLIMKVGNTGRVSHVTVSGDSDVKGRVTCYVFCGFGYKRRVSHVTVPRRVEGKGKRCHM